MPWRCRLGAAYGELGNSGAVIYLDWEEEEEEADTLDLPSGLCLSGAAHGVRVRSSRPARVGVYNLRGELVKAQNVTAGETLIGRLKPGAYLVRLSGGAGGLVKVR